MSLISLASAAIPAILQILPSFGKLIHSSALTDTDTLQFLDIAIGILNAGVDVPAKLKNLDDEIAGFVQRNESPPGTWWTEYRERSNFAHLDIQSAAADAEAKD